MLAAILTTAGPTRSAAVLTRMEYASRASCSCAISDGAVVFMARVPDAIGMQCEPATACGHAPDNT